MLILHRIHKAIAGPRKGQDVMVECFIKDGRKIAGGFALCDPRDKFDRRIGMETAYLRATRQMLGRKDKTKKLPVVTDEAIKTIESCGFKAPKTKACLISKRTLLSQACKLEQKFLDV